jgi:hypothetical protein
VSKNDDETIVYHGDLSKLDDGDVAPCVQMRDGRPRIGTLRRAEGNEPLEPHEQSVELRPIRRGVSVMRLTKPAQVATEAYREGYDRIFGTKQEVGQA